jgi:hypothetical protein
MAHGADIDDATPGETPLDRAVIMHDVPMATLLLAHGANADHPLEAGLPALHRAAIRGHAEIVRLLLAHRANPLARDPPGRSPLDWAVLEGWQAPAGERTDRSTARGGIPPISLRNGDGGRNQVREGILGSHRTE